jgi:hypothetical protein
MWSLVPCNEPLSVAEPDPITRDDELHQAANRSPEHHQSTRRHHKRQRHDRCAMEGLPPQPRALHLWIAEGTDADESASHEGPPLKR